MLIIFLSFFQFMNICFIDDNEVEHIEPQNMEWDEKNKCWMVGEPLPQNPTLQDIKDNWNNRKPMISAGRLKKIKKMHARADTKYKMRGKY